MKLSPRLTLLDYEILKHLNHDARVSASEIARVLNVNERTVRKHIDQLVERGVVRLSGIVDPLTFGYHITVDIFLEFDLQRNGRVIEELMQMAQISYLAHGQGTHTLSIQARFHAVEDMYKFLNETLAVIQGLKVTGYAIVPLVLRNIDSWMPPHESG
jgi:Lrp/AsnC family transcriptional regulator, regulator for asnA, asnC and gidA